MPAKHYIRAYTWARSSVVTEKARHASAQSPIFLLLVRNLIMPSCLSASIDILKILLHFKVISGRTFAVYALKLICISFQ